MEALHLEMLRALLIIFLLLPVRGWGQSHKEQGMDRNSTDADRPATLEIFFTDGNGKYFKSTPRIQLVDTLGKKLVEEFFRTIDAEGNPDPQVVVPGTYNLLVGSGRQEIARNVVIEARKKNKVTIKVPNGMLRFRYLDEEHITARPVEEFEAMVNIRFEPRPTMRIRCSQELELAPGTYYVEVNTIPITRFSVDIDFGAVTQIMLPEPGYAAFSGKAVEVRLYAPLGNKFVRFMDVQAGEGQEKLRLKPGNYEAHWRSGKNMEERVTHFHVKANTTTRVVVK